MTGEARARMINPARSKTVDVPLAIVSVVGAIVLLRATVGWWFDVLPEQREASVLVGPVVQISRSSSAVDHLASGQSIHRVQIPVEVHPYSTGILGGLAGAVAMAAVADWPLRTAASTDAVA